ncbi:hypothetical protein ES703_97076 [subsurface metagenome]
MVEKLQDRLFRLKARACGVEKPVMAILRDLPDEKIIAIFDGILETGLQSGDIEPMKEAKEGGMIP